MSYTVFPSGRADAESSNFSPAASGKQAYADVLRAFAAIAVVMIHVSGQGVVHTELISGFYRWVAIFFDAISRWSVPAFVMVSGALLLGSSKQETLAEFYAKRASRIGIPLVFWSVVFLVWRHYYVPEPELTLPKMWRAIFYGVPSFHLYFLFLILGLYLFTPMFRIFVRYATPTELWTTTGLALILTALSQQLRIVIGGWIQWTALDYFIPYIGFFLAGYAITHTRFTDRQNRLYRTLACIFLPLSIIVSVVGVGMATESELGIAIESYYQFSYPTAMIMALCVFFLGVDFYRHPGPIRRRIASVCAWVAPAAFGIYLIHPILLWEIFKRHGMPLYPNTLISCPGWTLALCVSCLAITKVIQLVPGLRRVVG